MMKKFTKLMLTLAFVVLGVGGASASKLYWTPASPWSGFAGCQWTAGTNTFSWNGTHDVVRAIQTGFSGDLSLYTTFHASVSDMTEGVEKLSLKIGDGTNEEIIDLVAGENNLDWPSCLSTVDASKISTFELWGPKIGVVECSAVLQEVYLEVVDPLEEYKAALNANINRAKMYNTFAYTSASFENLTSEITTAETALAAGDATEESLTTAKTNLEAKIKALEFKEGFEDLTAAMFKRYASVETPGAGSSTGCTYTMFSATDLPYGDVNVSELNWADLAAYDKIYIITNTDIKPRLCFNRLVSGGNEAATKADSKMIDINDNNGFSWSETEYQTIDGNVYAINLKKILSDYGFVRLHCIKKNGWGTGVVVTGMYLYTAPDPLAPKKELLSSKIAEANAINPFAKTAASLSALATAISEGQVALNDDKATEESLDNAKTAIEDAIAALAYEDGYTSLTTDMFKKWDDALNPTTSEATGCGYVLNSATDLPYGDGGVNWKNFADLTEYSKLQIVTKSGVPRLCMNRLTADGQIAATMEASKMLDINSNNGITWATERYCSKDSKVFTIDLSTMVKDYGYSRLNCIKNQWGDPLVVTDMLLYRTLTVGTTGYATFGSLTKNAKLNGVTAYAAVYNEGKLQLTEVSNVPAGKAVIVMGEAGSYAPTFDVEAADINSDLKVSNGTVAGDGSTIFVLADGNNGVGFYLVKAGTKIPAGKAYLVVPAEARQFIGFDFDFETTSIKSVENTLKANTVFNLRGQRVNNPTKGLYIVNGKKVVK